MRSAQKSPLKDASQTSAPRPVASDLSRLGAAYAQLGHPGHLTSGDPGRSFDEAIAHGSGVVEALESIGAPRTVVRFLELSRPADPASVLAALLPPLARADLRLRSLGAVGTYALLIAIVATLLCAHQLLVIRPLLLEAPGQSNLSALATQEIWSLVGASALALLSLVGLVTALKRRTASWPFAGARRRHARAQWLAGAAVLSRHGVALHTALRASAVLVPSRAEAHAVHSLAAALQQGRAASFTSVNEHPCFEMIARAATAGAAAESLDALAHWCGAEIDTLWPQVLARAELLGLVLAGAALAASGILFFEQYLGTALG